MTRTLVRFVRREHKPMSFSKMMRIAVLNAVCWTTCLALPTVVMSYVDFKLSM